MKFKKWDFQYFLEVDWWWGFVHLIGSAFLVSIFARFGIIRPIRDLTIFILGVLWECADGLFGGKINIFDPAGFSRRDLIYDIAGILTTELVLFIT
jgi:hypothetical protein